MGAGRGGGVGSGNYRYCISLHEHELDSYISKIHHALLQYGKMQIEHISEVHLLYGLWE